MGFGIIVSPSCRVRSWHFHSALLKIHACSCLFLVLSHEGALPIARVLLLSGPLGQAPVQGGIAYGLAPSRFFLQVELDWWPKKPQDVSASVTEYIVLLLGTTVCIILMLFWLSIRLSIRLSLRIPTPSLGVCQRYHPRRCIPSFDPSA